MPTKYDWEKWGIEFWKQLAQAMSVSGSTWLGLGVKNGRIDWDTLWVAMLTGAVFPTLWTFLRTSPVPPVEEVTVTQTTTITKTKGTDEIPIPELPKPELPAQSDSERSPFAKS